MMRVCQILGRAIPPLTALALLAGCETLPPDVRTGGNEAERRARTAIEVGNNLVGEPCLASAGTDDPGLGLDKVMSVRCGSWTQPSGTIARLASRMADEAGLRAALERSAWRKALDQRASCGAMSLAAGSGGLSVGVLNCRQRIGGWPYVALAIAVDGAVWVGDGVAPAAPALEAAVAVQTGRKVATETSAASRQVAADLGSRRFGAGDLADYQDLMERGAKFNLVNDYAQAELAFRDARATHQKLLPDDPAGIDPLMNLAVQISNQGRFREADRLFEAATALAPKADPLAAARLLHYRALHDFNLAKLQPSRDVFRAVATRLDAAEAAYRALVPGEDLSPDGLRRAAASRANSAIVVENAGSPVRANAVVGIVELYRLRAGVSQLTGDLDGARTAAQTALALLDSARIDAQVTRPRVLRQRAATHVERGDVSAAVADLERSVRLLDGVVPGTRPVANAYFALGTQLAGIGRVDEALSAFRDGAKIMSGSILGLPSGTVFPYLDTLYQAAERSGPEGRGALFREMLDATQIVKSSQTNTSILQAAARLSAKDPKIAGAIRDLQGIDRELAALNRRRDAEEGRGATYRSSEAIAAIDTEIRAVQERRASAEQAVQAGWAQYNQLVLTRSEAESLPELIAADEILWHMFAGPNRSYGFLVTRAGIHAYPIAITEEQLQVEVRTLRRALKIDASRRIETFDVVRAHRLYQTLFAGQAGRLAQAKSLTVVPVGALISLPFSVLVTDPVAAITDQDYRKVPWLLRKMAIRYAPALASLVTLRRNVTASQAPEPYIGFGAFRPAAPAQITRYFAGEACRRDVQTALDLKALPGTRGEVERVAKILEARGGTTRFDADFTKRTVTGAGLERYRVVHFATHAILPTDLRCLPEPALLFSTPAGAEQAGDAFFTAGEVASLTLNADLVVLSACNSAAPSGAFVGESLTGLARSFFYAGARGVLVTHWEVLDLVAPDIMVDLFATQRRGVGDAALALQAAQMRFLDAVGQTPQFRDPLFSHPFAWAPYALIGDAGTQNRAGR